MPRAPAADAPRNPATAPPSAPSLRTLLVLAVWLSLAAAVALGVTRFAYALLLPAMRADLHWNYAVAGSMNTANAAGYLLGALALPRLAQHVRTGRLLVGCAWLSAVTMALGGLSVQTPMLLALRVVGGALSAALFVCGGLLAARLAHEAPARSGLLLGLYYGGTGWGIAGSALGVPLALRAASAMPHPWQPAWWWLGACCALAAAALTGCVRRIERLSGAAAIPGAGAPQSAKSGSTASARAGALVEQGEADGLRARFRWRDFRFALAGYALFGLGYIGYMTFIVALLRGRGASATEVTGFYAALGLAVVASGRIWARLLGRRDGRPLALLNALLGVAVLLPVGSAHGAVTLASGLLFGATFLSVVASTTALVRHNLHADAWVAGISAFTLVFAVGQVFGPVLVGWVSDGAGLQRGLVVSALALWLGAALAWRQPALSAESSG